MSCASTVEGICVRRRALSLLTLAIALTSLVSVAADTVVFGPQTYRRDAGPPVTVKKTFRVQNPAPQYMLRVTNHGVTSGEIALNGRRVIGPADFHAKDHGDDEKDKNDQNVGNNARGNDNDNDDDVVPRIERSVALRNGVNEIAVELRGKPGTSLTIEIFTSAKDTTPPTITTAIAPAPNANGWNHTDVTFAAIDALSGVAPGSLTSPITLASNGSSLSASGQAIDLAGNVGTATLAGINIDQAQPVILVTLTPSPNANGWYSGPVTAHFTCVDPGSGVNTCPSDQVTTAEGINTVIGTVTDKAGNTASATSDAIRIDLGPPSISATLTPAPNANGWNNSPVTVHFDCSDPGAGIATCPPDQAVSTDGFDQNVTGTATDRAGNTAVVFARVNIDRTAPALAFTSPADGATLLTATVSATGTVADDLSGLAGVTCNDLPATFSGGTMGRGVTLARGANSITAIATDLAGNNTSVAPGVKYAPLPRVRITSPDNISYLNISPTTVTGTVDDDTALVSINSVPAPAANGSFSIALPLAEGPNIITASASSQEGAAGTASISVTLDTTPPHVTITSPPDQFVTAESSISVAGNVNDLVVGTVNDQQAQVSVNGANAQVANRTFLAADVPLALGPNTIQAIGRDRVGNSATTQITVVRRALTQAQIRPVSGNNQFAAIESLVADPLVVALTDALGNPVPNQPVIFKVSQNDGTLVAAGGSGASVSATTDARGRASAQWRLGHRAGAGGNSVEAYSVGFEGIALFNATGTQGAAGKIVVDTGNDQIGVIDEPLPKPFIAVVVDAGNNRLGGVPVTFSVIQGGGKFDGQDNVVVVTDPDGRAEATLTLGTQEGNANNFVQANVPSNQSFAAGFTASGRAPGNPADTTITGVVLDNSNSPSPGVTIRAVLTNVIHSNLGAAQTAPAAQTDAQGQFSLGQAPVGFVKLLVDGATAQLPGTYPSLEYDMVTIAGQNNTVGQPMYLLPLNADNQLCVTPSTGGGTLTIPEAPGFSLTFGPGQVTFPGGSQTGCISVTVVNGDKVPMVPSFGQQPRFIVTIQPSGAVFNPPATITLPNVDGLLPREVTEMYSFDHDIGSFVAIGTGVVSDDGVMIRSSPGVGVLKAGWHCGGNPSPTGAAADCPVCQVCTTDHCEADPSQNGQTLPDDKCQICKDGSPTSIDLSKTDVEVSYKFGAPSPAVERLNDALDKLKAIGVIASVNLLEIEGKLSSKECCEPETGKGKGTELSGSGTGDFGGFPVKGKIWPPGPIPSFEVKIDVFGVASLEAKAEFVGGIFLGLTGKVTGEIGYKKKECSKDPADQAGCVFGKLELGLTPSISAEIGGTASITFDCFFCDKTTIAVAASFIAGDLSWPISIAGIQYNTLSCSSGLVGGFFIPGEGKFQVQVKFSGSYKTDDTGSRKVEFTFTFVECTINGSGVSCSTAF